MPLSSTLAWLVDEALASPGGDRFLAELGACLTKDGLPLAGGALTLAALHLTTRLAGACRLAWQSLTNGDRAAAI
jgi:hypothetical protein